MIHYDKPSQLLAVGLSAIAGYVDAVGFLYLGGYFASFMSGNSTRFAVGLALERPEAGIAGTLVGTFVLGVMLGAFTSYVAGTRRPAAVLALVTLLLAIAATLHQSGQDRPAVIAMVLAMGTENAVFQRNGDVSIGLTYMTGTLVKFGQRLTGALLGRNRWSWLPYAMLWSGLVVGAYLGATIYPYLQLGALWVAVAAALFLTLTVWAMPQLLGEADLGHVTPLG
ncbi:YoaK family protein [Lichenifustis flavocetrariae]|uniref:YoaK family protein n=1 Tax=Lichenifustis flavocetrariae TaxID=2949735 RepID=A0AA41Z1L4_9HYPH|nr:YoaK family protein [Lichenifustis flavocetrariae]MCW6508710.1 YoaK family protein [Lichenifustis flavocetrariae]